MAVMDCPPSVEILVREPEGFALWTGPPFSNGHPGVKLERVPCINAKFSEDGSRLMVMKSDSLIIIYDCKSSKEIRSFEALNVLAATLSPRGTYLQTFQKFLSPQEKNVILWKTKTGDSVYNLFQENMTEKAWPSIRFSSDEAVACHLATNEIQIFDARDFSKGIIYCLQIPGIAAVELSKTPGSHVAAFVPESKGIPAGVQIFSCEKDLKNEPLAQQWFSQCSAVQLSWNNSSTGLLVVVQSDVDKINQSYYGGSKLNYLTTDGTHEGLVPLCVEGPVHDVQWSYSGSEFAVVYGFMPAKATVFDKQCNPLLELGTGLYNTIRWNPKGKFLCLAGFGNLPGDMTFWDFMGKKQLRTTNAKGSVTSEWSPDGRYFMTATTAPRIQVDNGINIFHPNGLLYFKKMFEKLYQAEWKPESPDRFGEITEFGKSLELFKVEETKPLGQWSKSSQASAKATFDKTPAQNINAYLSPHAKNAAAIQVEPLSSFPPVTTMASHHHCTRNSRCQSMMDNGSPTTYDPTEPTKRRRKGISGQKPKAIWDKRCNEVFIDLCVQEKLHGNMPSTHFNKTGWVNILRKFSNITGKRYDRLQLKNHWDNLKKDWQAFQSLAGLETELGWDHEKQTVSASDEWWENKMKKNPKVSKFREKGLENREKLDALFGNISTPGATVLDPNSGLMPTSFSKGDLEQGSADAMNDDDDDVCYPNLDDIPMEDDTPVADDTNVSERPTLPECSSRRSDSKSTQREGKKMSGGAKFEQQLDHLVGAVESTATSSMVQIHRCSSKDAMTVLRRLPGVQRNDEIFMLGTRLFLNQENRDMFVHALEDDEERLAWLKQEQRREYESMNRPRHWL
ncbi:hypothetical protein F0562_006721 [Nyssa sinensis]|uniref:Eukaryotic translation initiation factor 2A n=1 Tax=Nyssa sinensis TaxID=561372 RepID=A0A5J5ARY4_9ASTE|nr:hypothetical protein F0562_006721 [Nyssa sinensis]